MNRDTALTQQQINMVNQVTPDGSLTYTKNGESSFVDSSGKTVTTPTYTATTTLSPQQQAIKAQTDKASLNLGAIASQQSDFLKNYLAKPFTGIGDFQFDNTDASNWAYDLGAQRILPQQQKNEEALRSRLIASGLRPGSAGWDSEMQRLTNANTDQINQLALTGREQAYNEALQGYQTNFQTALQKRNQPINEISALLGGSQVQSPQFASTPTANVGGVDYTGLVNNKYQADVSASNAKMGGLFGLAAAPFSMFSFSDARLKDDIRRVGTLDNGLPVYAYRMIDGGPTQIGLLAHEVEALRPEAVITHDSGYKMVDYGRAAI